jgi:hypothetical protein
LTAWRPRGITVSAHHVYLLKSKSSAKRRKARGTKLRAVAAARPGIRDHAEAVQQVKVLAHQLGGIPALKALVDVLAEWDSTSDDGSDRQGAPGRGIEAFRNINHRYVGLDRRRFSFVDGEPEDRMNCEFAWGSSRSRPTE